MKFNKHVFLALVIITYTVAYVVTFDELYDSVMISSIALIGLCGWIYGIRIGLFSIFPYLLLNTAILYLVSGQPYDILRAYNPLGIILAMIIVLVIGLMRESQDKLNELRDTLASRIDEATSELDKLAQQLIENDEQERIQIGQDLHDGAGQYLTGLLLHSEALSMKLREAKWEEADLAEQITQRIHENIQTVRQLSRSLLPIQLTETNLETALDELIAYFSELSEVSFRLKCSGDSMNIPDRTAQHLYRITHEAIHTAIYENKASDLDVRLIIGRHNCRIRIQGRGITRLPCCSSNLVSEVMKYRIKAIDGKQVFTAMAQDGFRLEYSVTLYEETKR